MNLFSRSKESSDPTIIIDNCLKAVVNRISDDLDGEVYHWEKPWGVKRFESIVLAKFLINLAFNILSEDKLKDDEKIGFENLCNTSFIILFNDEFSIVGINFEDMQEEIQQKIDRYLEVRRKNKAPICWHTIFQQIIRSSSKEDIEEDIQKKSEGLELIKGNENFASMVPQYETQIIVLNDKVNSFEYAEMMISHMLRFTRDKLRAINLKKIKALSNKLKKQDKGKKK